MLTSSSMKSTIKIKMKSFLKFVICITCFSIITGAPELFSQDNNAEIIFSSPAGFYENAITVSLTSNIQGAVIHLSADGKEPGTSSPKYFAPFKLIKTTVVKARLFNNGIPVSKTFTSTYFINEKITLPVFSISTHPGNFFDPDTGIYVLGPEYEQAEPNFHANFWEDWERPVHIEFFENDGSRVVDMDAGVKIFGGWSRAIPQKSLALFARKKYGAGKIKHKFFENRPFTEFESLVLRNAGNDWYYSMMRDGMMQGLLEGVDIETQAFRPSVVFINGQYWGIHNIREKINEHFIAQHHNLNPDSIDILETDGVVVQGSNSHYKSLINFISTADLSNQNNYLYVKLRMDVENFITYQIAQIYFNNTDWPGNNIKFWRPHTNEGKWRWLLYDTDFGFGLFGDKDYMQNGLEFATDPDEPGWPNPPWSTLILRKLLTNSEFRNSFISRFSEFSNTIFKADVVVNKIRKYSAVIKPEVERHFARWGNTDYEKWVKELNDLEIFANNRIQYMRIHFANKFQLFESRQLSLNAQDAGNGIITIGAVNVTKFPWTGSFYKGVPLKITAIPSQGYVFKEWKGIAGVAENIFTFSFPIHLSVSAVFAQDTTPKPDVVINEINYNSAADFDCEDWIELYNNSDIEVDLSGFILKDSNDDNSFIFPAGTKIPGKEYIVVCSNDSAFSQFYPDVNNKIGNLGFSISNGGELIRLLDKNNNYIDSVHFRDKEPWPTEPDGSGATLALKDASSDNYLPENWSASLNHGTPGAINDISLSVANDDFTFKDFTLSQNFPNPFNSATRIKYSIMNPAYIKFRIFDVLGREVYYLDKGYEYPGTHTMTFNAENLSTGVYYYQISLGSDSQTKTMLLLK